MTIVASRKQAHLKSENPNGLETLKQNHARWPFGDLSVSCCPSCETYPACAVILDEPTPARDRQLEMVTAALSHQWIKKHRYTVINTTS